MKLTDALREGAECKRIVLDLFAPEHFDGCLFKENSRLPCQCGYYDRKERYHAAVRRAKEIAATHDYMSDEALSDGATP